MARKNKNHKTKVQLKNQTPHRWVLLLLVVGIVFVSYAVVAANREPTLDLSAALGTAERDKELQGLEQKQETTLLNTYDVRYNETLLLDSSSSTAVMEASQNAAF